MYAYKRISRKIINYMYIFLYHLDKYGHKYSREILPITLQR